MRRYLVTAGLLVLGLVSIAAVATAVTPETGDWIGAKASFKVNAAGNRITSFAVDGCATPYARSIKIKKNGKFHKRGKQSQAGGPLQKTRIKGRFTSATSARGYSKFGKCKVRFVVNAQSVAEPGTTAEPQQTAEPEETAEPEPTEEPEEFDPEY